jgi:hypothetical protein
MKRVHNFDLVTSCWIFSNRIFWVFVEHKNCLVSLIQCDPKHVNSRGDGFFRLFIDTNRK